MSVASGGQIIVSNVTASLLQSGVADLAYHLSDLGSHRLRGLAEPERLWQVDAPDLPGAFPPVHSERPGPVGLPVHRSSLVGRTDDERRVRALLDHNRVVTLTGVGGVGKTRLAAHVARRLLSEYGSIGFTDPVLDHGLVRRRRGDRGGAERSRRVDGSRWCGRAMVTGWQLAPSLWSTTANTSWTAPRTRSTISRIAGRPSRSSPRAASSSGSMASMSS